MSYGPCAARPANTVLDTQGPCSLRATAGFGFGPNEGRPAAFDGTVRLAFPVDGGVGCAGVVVRQPTDDAPVELELDVRDAASAELDVRHAASAELDVRHAASAELYVRHAASAELYVRHAASAELDVGTVRAQSSSADRSRASEPDEGFTRHWRVPGRPLGVR